MLKLVILDVNGTLFPLDPVAEELAAVGLRGQLDVWFARVLRDGFAAAVAGTFVAFPDLARHHLAVLLEDHGIESTEDRLAQVFGGFDRVTAHEDVEPALQRLRHHGVTVTTMTNGTVAITRGLLERDGLDGLVDATYDVTAARAGLRTGWVNRTGTRYPDGLAVPDVSGRSMASVVDGLLAR